MPKYIVLLFLLCVLSGCGPVSIDTPGGEQTMLDDMDWLIGSWERLRKDSTKAYEDWQQVSPTQLHGQAWRPDSTGQKKVLEKLSITLRDSPDGPQLVYSADVPHNATPIEFVCAGPEAKVWSFRNPKHDFPQLISYQPDEDAESLLVEVSAPNPDGADQVIKFEFRRCK